MKRIDEGIMEAREKSRVFLENAFPGKEINEVDTFWAMPEWLLSGRKGAAVDYGKQEGLLHDIQRAVQTLSIAVHALDPDLLGALGQDIWRRAMLLEYELKGVEPRVMPPRTGGSEPSPLRKQEGGLKRARRELMKRPVLSTQGVRHELRRKIHFMQEAARLFEKYTGQTAPDKASPGTPFFEFVEDLIEYVEVKWNAASVVNAVYSWEKGQRSGAVTES